MLHAVRTPRSRFMSLNGWRTSKSGKRAAGRARHGGRCRSRLVVEELESRTLLSATALTLAAPGFPVDTAGGDSLAAAVSADGRYLAFTSPATNLVAGQVATNGRSDV